jgi:hypothetical protein
MEAVSRHALKRCLVKSPKVSERTSTSILAGWMGAAAASLFLAYKVVDDEYSSRPTTLLQGSGNFSPAQIGCPDVTDSRLRGEAL